MSATRSQGRRYAGKSATARRHEQHTRILLAARDAFASLGYAGAAVEDIVARAHVSRTTFYSFFDNKEQCLLAVYRFGLERIGTAVAQAAARSQERGLAPPDLIREEVRAVLAAYAEDPALARIVLIEIVGATPAAERLHARTRSITARAIEQRLEQYPYWRRRSERDRRVASLATMAATAEPIADLVAADRLDEWEELVEPVSQFIARALVSPS